MEISYSALYIHFILTTKFRQPLIPEKNRERIEKYITGVVKNYCSRLYAIYANPDYLNLVISKSPDISENTIATIIAESSAKFINKNKLSAVFFEWHNTASAISVSKADVDKVCRYILNQKAQHAKPACEEEYIKFVNEYEIILGNLDLESW